MLQTDEPNVMHIARCAKSEFVIANRRPPTVAVTSVKSAGHMIILALVRDSCLPAQETLP